MLIIGFGHRARQGKNTAALAVLNSLPLDTNVQVYAFADALKSEVRVACGQAGGQFNLIKTWQEAGLMPEWVRFEDGKPRSLLQWWGTDFRRAKHPDYWVNRLKAKLDAHTPDVALITDVRFPNEVHAIRSWGGVYVKVVNTGTPDIPVREHASEAALDGFAPDHIINAGSVTALQEQAVYLYRQIVRSRAVC